MTGLTVGPFDPSVYASLALLFGIAAQFRAMDGYSFLRGVLAYLERRMGVLFAVSLLTFVVSPFILNDVVVLILTPAIIRYSKGHGIDAVPLIVAEVTFTNISSSLTPIGNPQNIILWTSSGVGFVRFVEGTWAPVFASAAIASVALVLVTRRARGPRGPPAAIGRFTPAAYLAYVAAAVLAANLYGLPSYVPLAAGFLGGFASTGRSLRALLREFDVKSLLVLYAFITAVAFAAYYLSGYIAPFVAPAAQGVQPYSGEFVGVLSNVISNVPVTQLLVNTSGVSAHVAPKIAVEAGLAGNLGPVASFANLIALRMAAREGLSVKKAVGLQALVGIISYLPALL
ncbi:MAG: hypothetical protein JRN46_01060 [Nitrososphaerota archaeon]|nr:hypothetical protein [Nitrososphaerota archaeon]